MILNFIFITIGVIALCCFTMAIFSIRFAIDLVYEYHYTKEQAKKIEISWVDKDYIKNIYFFFATRIFVPIVYLFKRKIRR